MRRYAAPPCPVRCRAKVKNLDLRSDMAGLLLLKVKNLDLGRVARAPNDWGPGLPRKPVVPDEGN